MKHLFAIFFSLLFLVWGGVRIVESIQFDQNVEGYLKRAADANTVELARENLTIAVKYLEDKNFTSGYTSILWRTPDEDIGFWYKNLRDALDELHAVRVDASQLEKTNVLMKLRETLLDGGHGGETEVTAPAGMSVYPNNAFYAWWGTLSFLLAAGFVLAVAAEDNW